MHDFSTCHIEVSQDEIITSRVQVVLDVFNGIDSLFMIFEGPEMELFLGVHNLYLSCLVSGCKDSSIRPDANSGQIIDKINLPRRSLLPRRSQHNGPSMTIREQIMRIVVVGDGSHSMRVTLQHLGLVLLPIALLISEFVSALRRGEDFQLVVAQFHALLIIIICMNHANIEDRQSAQGFGSARKRLSVFYARAGLTLGFEFSKDDLLEPLQAGGQSEILGGLFGVFSSQLVDSSGFFKEQLVELLIFCLKFFYSKLVPLFLLLHDLLQMKYISIYCQLFLCLSQQFLRLAILQDHSLHLNVELRVYFALYLRTKGLSKLLQNILNIFQIQAQLFFSISLPPLTLLADQLPQSNGKRHMKWRIDHPPMQRRCGVKAKRRNIFLFIDLRCEWTRCGRIISRIHLFLFPILIVHQRLTYNRFQEQYYLFRSYNTQNNNRMQPYFTPYSSNTSSQGYCNICYNQYDLGDNKPLLICSQDHSICRECLKAIRRNLRCPFCRENIRLNRIRLNRVALELVVSKLNQHHNGRKKFLNVTQNERLNTDYTVDIAELIDPHEDSFAEESQERQSMLLKFLVFLQLFLLQLPIGIYPFYLGMFSAQDICLDRPMANISMNLRNLFLVQGYVKCLIGFLTAYFTAFYNVQLMTWQGLMAFYFMLLAAIQMKSVICACIYIQIIKQNVLSTCENTIKNYSMLDLGVNCCEFVLGFYLIIKYLRMIREDM